MSFLSGLRGRAPKSKASLSKWPFPFSYGRPWLQTWQTPPITLSDREGALQQLQVDSSVQLWFVAQSNPASPIGLWKQCSRRIGLIKLASVGFISLIICYSLSLQWDTMADLLCGPLSCYINVCGRA